MTSFGDRRPNLLSTPAGRRWLFALLYFSEGAPIGFVWWALPTLLRSQGVALDSITALTTVATLPWILKFVAAPFIDAALHRGITVKHWILVCQVAMALTLIPLLALDWREQFGILIAVVAVHATFAAVQDVGIDTLAIHTVPPAELGRINGWMQAGMLGGRAGVAAGTTLIATALGDATLAVIFLSALIAVPALVLLTAVAVPRVEQPRVRFSAVLRLITSPVALAGALVALFAGAGFEFFGVSAGPRLIDLAISEAAVAAFFGFFAPAGLAIGALAGGGIADRIGALNGSALSLGMLSLVLIWIALGDVSAVLGAKHYAWFVVAYVAIGALTASSYALLMSLSRGEFAATRFSFFMAMTNACEAWAGFVGGRLAVESGYGYAVIVLTGASGVVLLPLLFLWRTGLGRGTDDEE
jgi:hypothetical protein